MADLLAPRWRGQPGRLEAWYLSASDPERRLGLWVHHELVAPLDGTSPYCHGWVAVFRHGAVPVLDRFGPQVLPPPAPRSGGAPSRAGGARQASPPGTWFDPPQLRGTTGRLRWDLQLEAATVGGVEDSHEPPPLFTFPEWAWHRELLPGAQMLPVPTAPLRGRVEVDGTEVELSTRCRGGVAHIYSHGSAERWGWLHGDLGDGDVLEIVTATGRRPGLDRLPPYAFVQLRHGGRDWPVDPAAAGVLFRSHLGLPDWHVAGIVGRYRLQVEVTIPMEQAVVVGYTDPDGSTATCTNSELADADIVLQRRGARWETVAAWRLRNTAHAEIGTRP